MSLRFRKHYSLEDAREMLPQIRSWFSEIDALTGRIHETDQDFAPRLHRSAKIQHEGLDLGIRKMVEDLPRLGSKKVPAFVPFRDDN